MPLEWDGSGERLTEHARSPQPEVVDDGWGDARTESRVERLERARKAVAEAVTDAPDPGHPLFSEWNRRLAEVEVLKAMPLASARPIDSYGHINEVDVVDSGGEVAFFKPASGEPDARDDIPQGDQHRREVAAAIVDDAFGFDLVPPTVLRHHPELGPGSLQMGVPGEALPPWDYDSLDRQRLGALDYVIGQTDRHIENYKSQWDGRPAAIDNGLAFPEGEAQPLRSVFFGDVVDRPLDPAVVAELRAVDVVQLKAQLAEIGLNSAASDGLERRLAEAQSGLITGAAHSGGILYR